MASSSRLLALGQPEHAARITAQRRRRGASRGPVVAGDAGPVGDPPDSGGGGPPDPARDLGHPGGELRVLGLLLMSLLSRLDLQARL